MYTINNATANMQRYIPAIVAYVTDSPAANVRNESYSLMRSGI
jgi:hypothetical protein